MKKIILMLAVIGLTVASCSKDHTCTCTDSTPGSTPETRTLVKTTSGQAKANCISTVVTSGTFVVTTTCKLS